MAPAYSWTGFYVGGQAGVAFNRDAGDVRYNPNTGVIQTTAFSGGSDNSDDAAFIGGVHVGYDYQINNFLIGAVADINYIDATSDSTTRSAPTCSACRRTSTSSAPSARRLYHG